MAQVRLEDPEGGELILDGEFADLNDVDKRMWQDELRRRREYECFAISDRAVWFYGLTEEQKAEVQHWRQAWLDAPETGTIPVKPDWIEVR